MVQTRCPVTASLLGHAARNKPLSVHLGLCPLAASCFHATEGNNGRETSVLGKINLASVTHQVVQ